MAKKLSLLMTAVAVLAFAVPAFVNAAPAFTSSKNVLAKAGPGETGSTLTFTSTNFQLNGSLGLMTCEHFVVTAWLTQNTSTEVEAADEAGASNSATNCHLPGTPPLPITVTGPTLTTLKATSTSKTVSLDFTLSELGCTFSGTVPFTYAPGGSSIHVGGTLATSNPCGKTGTVAGDFTVAIGGTHVIID